MISRLISRRVAVADMGKAGMAIMVVGFAACPNETGGASTPSFGDTTSSTGSAGTTPSPTTQPSDTTTAPGTAGTTSWHRVALPGVSAYILYRNGEGALVDTGNPGDHGAIEAALAEVGLGWDAIGHVIVTHKHGDHQGSAEAIAQAAPGATFYAGAGDAPSIRLPAPPTIVGDSDRVFDLSIIETPGHTPGHITVHDAASGILVAGDSLNGAGSGVSGSDSGVAGANPRFSEDMTLAADSIRKLAELSFEVILFGHGEPLLEGGTAAVQALVADA